MASRQPSRASTWAMANPSPRLAPVTTATRSWRPRSSSLDSGRRAAADQCLLGLRVEQVDVAGVHRHLDSLSGLQVRAARVYARGERPAAEVEIGEDLAAHAFHHFDLGRHLGQGAIAIAGILEVLGAGAPDDLPPP